MAHPLTPATLATLTLAATQPLQAETRWYLLGAMGPSSYGGGVQSQNDAELERLGKTGISSTSTSNSNGYKLMVGYQFSPTWAVEGGYVDMGAINYSATYSGGSVGTDSKITGLHIAGLVIGQANYQLGFFGKLGYTMGTVTAKGASGSASVSLTESRSSLGMGIGCLYGITPNVGVRVEWEKLFSDIQMLTFGLQAKF